MPVRLHHIVVDAHDLPGLARFWTQALGWKVLSERENEIVIGTDENAPVGMCFMPVTDPKTVKNACISTSPAAPRTAIRRPAAFSRSGLAGPASARPAPNPGLSSPARRETSSASCARSKRSSDEAQHREPQTDPVRGIMPVIKDQITKPSAA
jgi:Glyoxalase-like domain